MVIAIECLGTLKIPPKPKRTAADRKKEGRFERKVEKWKDIKIELAEKFDQLQMEREAQIISFVEGYHGEVLSIFQDEPSDCLYPDSFTVRMKISGVGLKDLALNFQYVFEVSEPEDIGFLDGVYMEDNENYEGLELTPPENDSPYVCVIDSGVQEGHVLLKNSIDEINSKCFIPSESDTDVADYVINGGHGSRVAGAVLYKEVIPESGEHQLPFWIRNARVLDENNCLRNEMLPEETLKKVVDVFVDLEPPTKIFNHSINSSASFRPSRMSAWAAEMDNLCYVNDILFIQSAGNISISNPNHSSLGVEQHLLAGRTYPNYLLEPSSQIANPAQSMHAITVGSIAYDSVVDGDKSSFAKEKDQPSCFTRAGLGLWGAIKPDVVEYGGDLAVDSALPPTISCIEDAAPELVRSTLHSRGPGKSRDTVGTSFAAPKVAHIAAQIQKALPDESSQLYRSLIACSARWPEWAENYDNKLDALKMLGYGIPSMERCINSTEKSITLVSSGNREIGAQEGHLYSIPIPEALRAAGNEFDVRIDVSLAYVSPVRRTRKHNRKYFGTWVDWNVSRSGESIESIKGRLFRDQAGIAEDGGAIFPWALREREEWGEIKGASRKNGTLQKDWAIVPAHSLPRKFGIAVVGHAGFDINSICKARYALSVSIEAMEFELNLYELISAEIDLVTEVEVQVGV